MAPPSAAALLHELQELRQEGPLGIAARGCVVGMGAGAVIGCFRLLYDVTLVQTCALINTGAHTLSGALLLFGALAVLGVAGGYLVKSLPLISGSGIPHVELVLRGQAPMPWKRVLMGKFIGTQLSLIGGLSSR